MADDDDVAELARRAGQHDVDAARQLLVELERRAGTPARESVARLLGAWVARIASDAPWQRATRDRPQVALVVDEDGRVPRMEDRPDVLWLAAMEASFPQSRGLASLLAAVQVRLEDELAGRWDVEAVAVQRLFQGIVLSAVPPSPIRRDPEEGLRARDLDELAMDRIQAERDRLAFPTQLARFFQEELRRLVVVPWTGLDLHPESVKDALACMLTLSHPAVVHVVVVEVPAMADLLRAELGLKVHVQRIQP